MPQKKTTKKTAKRNPADAFAALENDLNSSLVERTREVRGLLVALLAREHVLLLGPPGTAKTMLTELASNAVGANYFYWLMSRFTVPEELFGNFSLSALKQDKFKRITTGKLPEAELAFLDEVN